MKKILLSFALIMSAFLGFAQSVTILPTTQLGGGGGGSSQWTTSGSNISYGTLGGFQGVMIGSNLFPTSPLHVVSTANDRTATFENANNGLPGISLDFLRK
ncbi:MAG: hypothetical protein U5M51_02795 [Emticicia sp.]|nr:hypothetical protein [Emticicia sp.]